MTGDMMFPLILHPEEVFDIDTKKDLLETKKFMEKII
jgi:hypothetical protein